MLQLHDRRVIARPANLERMLPHSLRHHGRSTPSVSRLADAGRGALLPAARQKHHRVFWFALATGCLLSVFPLVGQIPAVANWYFGTAQNLPLSDKPLAMRTMLLVSVLPVIQSLRGHAEGLAAWRKRPNAILAGQAIYLASLVCVLFVTMNMGMQGYMMGGHRDPRFPW
jgi:hypothetical protein